MAIVWALRLSGFIALAAERFGDFCRRLLHDFPEQGDLIIGKAA